MQRTSSLPASDTLGGSKRTRAAVDVALWLAPVLVFVAVYHPALSAWWMNDDSMALLSLARHGVLPHFYRPLVELELPPTNLTPWFYAAYGIDFALGGLDPRTAYVHNFISWTATLVALTIALRRWLDATTVTFVLVWFVLAIPTSTVAELLCTRHYLEGLFASTVSIIAYSAYRQSGRFLHVAVSALLYAWATTAKEIYVPLGLLLIVHHALFDESTLDGGSGAFRRALHRLLGACSALWPYMLVAAAYVLYRGHMLGFDRLFTGYGVAEWRTRPSMLLDFPKAWQWAFHWSYFKTAVWVGLVSAGIAVWLPATEPRLRWRGVLLGVVVAIALLAPIYPVLGILTVFRWNPHYLLVPGLAFFALAGWAARQCLDRFAASTSADVATASRSGSRIEIALWAIVVVLTITQIHSAWNAAWPWSEDDHIARYRVEGEHELYATERSLIVDAIGPPWHHHGLRGIRAQLLALPEGPEACAGRDCVDATQRQRDRGGTCVRYFGDPPRLARVACTMPAESGARSHQN